MNKANNEQIKIGRVVIEAAQQDLLQASVPAIMLSANNGLRASLTSWSWSQEVQNRAGASYQRECSWLSESAGSEGLHRGTAVVTGAGDLRLGTELRWVIQAITIHYGHHGERQPATPEIVYRAVRAGLEKAETYRMSAVATYLMAIRPGYAAAGGHEMAQAMFSALIDHAAITAAMKRLVVCERDPARFDLALRSMKWATR